MDIKELLLSDEVEYVGRIVSSSNHALLVKFTKDDYSVFGIYKPVNFERPLWDFEPGLYKREYLAFVSASLMNFDVVPVTVIRDDLQYGTGSVQHFLNNVNYYDYFEAVEQSQFHIKLFSVAIMDLIINNADRKAGHVLVTDDNRLYAIDNGLSFNIAPKLRTVIWEFINEELTEEAKFGIRNFVDSFENHAEDLLTKGEIDKTLNRADALLDLGRFPNVSEEDRSYPWPIY